MRVPAVAEITVTGAPHVARSVDNLQRAGGGFTPELLCIVTHFNTLIRILLPEHNYNSR